LPVAHIQSDQKSSIIVYDTIYYEPIYEFAIHSNPISHILIYQDRFVFSNCMEGKVYHWQIMDVEKPTGRFENPARIVREQHANCFAHDSSKPYTACIYDEKQQLFVGTLPEKYISR
jgi:hypothetical protein